MLDKGKVPCDELSQLGEPANGIAMNHDPDFYAQAASSEVQNASNCLIERFVCLHDEVVLPGNVGIEGYANYQVRMIHGCQFLRQ